MKRIGRNLEKTGCLALAHPFFYMCHNFAAER